MEVASHWWICNFCQVSFLINTDDKLLMMIYDEVSLGERKYRIMIDFMMPPMISITETRGYQNLISAQYPIDHITPTNVHEKLKTYLTFL
jgi:hypothetical protein